MYPNTKKELFLGKKPFKAQKLTPDELINKIVKCIFNNIDIEEYGYDDEDLRIGDIETIFELLGDLIAAERNGDSTKIGKILSKELNIVGACLAAAADYKDDWLEVITLSNGFTFIKVLSTNGDDSMVPVYVLLYIGDDDMIHGYIPMYGNNVFVGTNIQLGLIGDSDYNKWQSLLNEYGVVCNINNQLSYDKARFETYAKKYGIEKTPIDATYTNRMNDGDYVESLLELNTNYIEEDIISNVTLI